MRIPKNINKYKNLIAFLFLGVVLSLFGWKWAKENGYFSSLEQSTPLISISELKKDGDAKGKRQETEEKKSVLQRGEYGNEFRRSFRNRRKKRRRDFTDANGGIRDGRECFFQNGRLRSIQVASFSGTSAGTRAVPAREEMIAKASVSDATQSELMRIQSDIMLLQARVEKAKLQAELEKLEAPATATPSVTKLTPELLASLTPPSGGKAPAPVTPEPKARLIGRSGNGQKDDGDRGHAFRTGSDRGRWGYASGKQSTRNRQRWAASGKRQKYQVGIMATTTILDELPDEFRDRVTLSEGRLFIAKSLQGEPFMLSFLSLAERRGINENDIIWEEDRALSRRMKNSVELSSDSAMLGYAKQLLRDAYALRASDIHLVDTGPQLDHPASQDEPYPGSRHAARRYRARPGCASCSIRWGRTAEGNSPRTAAWTPVSSTGNIFPPMSIPCVSIRSR